MLVLISGVFKGFIVKTLVRLNINVLAWGEYKLPCCVLKDPHFDLTVKHNNYQRWHEGLFTKTFYATLLARQFFLDHLITSMSKVLSSNWFGVTLLMILNIVGRQPKVCFNIE